MAIHDWTRVDAGTFHDFHATWLVELKRALNSGVLPADYYAMAEQVAGGLHPDVLTLEEAPPQNGGPREDDLGVPGKGGIAVTNAPPRVRFTLIADSEVYARKRNRIAIRHASGDDVVAVLEVVSPGNKSSRHALRAFVNKSAELLDAGIHLLVVDLFPPGPRDPQGIHGAIWTEISQEAFELPVGKPLTLAAYAVGQRRTAYVEPVCVGDPLPPMPLFLREELYVQTPLEETYQSAFDAVPRRWRDILTAEA